MKLLVATFLIALSANFSIISGQSRPANSSTPIIVGTWRLIAYEDHPDDSPVVYPFGKNQLVC
jgi:hypothetical protein